MTDSLVTDLVAQDPCLVRVVIIELIAQRSVQRRVEHLQVRHFVQLVENILDGIFGGIHQVGVQLDRVLLLGSLLLLRKSLQNIVLASYVIYLGIALGVAPTATASTRRIDAHCAFAFIQSVHQLCVLGLLQDLDVVLSCQRLSQVPLTAIYTSLECKPTHDGR